MLLVVTAFGCIMLLGLVGLVLWMNNDNKKRKNRGGSDGQPPIDDGQPPIDDGQPPPIDDDGQPPPSTGSCNSLFCTTGAKNSGGEYSFGSPPRYQFQVGDDGYCGETSIQVTMLKHGVWLPAEYVRMQLTDSAEGDVLVENRSYQRMGEDLKLDAEQFGGSGYKAYMEFVKKNVVAGNQVIIVYQFSGSGFDDYGHIVPVAGIRTSNPSGGYNADDTLILHTHFTDNLVTKKVGSYQCGGGSGGNVMSGGCVPGGSLTGWAWAVKGPKYLGIGPRVEVRMASNKQPGLDSSVSMRATVVVYGLTSGKKYNLYELKSVGSVPTSPSATLSGSPWKTFTASGSTYKASASFPSNQPRWYIATAA